MTNTTTQQRLLEVLQTHHIKLNTNGSIEQKDDDFGLTQEAGVPITIGEAGRYTVIGTAGTDTRPASLTITDTTNGESTRVNLKKAHAPQTQARDFFDRVSEEVDINDLAAKINSTDIVQTGIFLHTMFKDTLDRDIPNSQKVTYINQANALATNLKPEQAKRVISDIQAIISSKDSVNEEIAARARKYPDLYLFKTLLLVRNAITKGKDKQQAFNSLMTFARNLRKLLDQGKKETVPVAQSSSAKEDPEMTTVIKGLNAAANGDSGAETPAKFMTQS